MENNTLAVITRNVLKKTANKNLRKEGQIPAVVYGHGTLKNIAVSEREFEKKYHKVSENTIITLLDNEKAICDVLLKDYQENLTTQRIQHIDFYEVEKGSLLRTHVPVVITGSSAGVKAGGLLEQITHEIEVECLPKNIPGKIEVNVDKLDIGHTIHLKDIEKIIDVKFMASDDLVIVHVVHAKVIAVEETETAEGVEAEAPKGE